MENGNILQANKISYRYPGAAEKAIEDFSMAVAPGRRTMVKGRCGSGKTTLLYALQGIVPSILGGLLEGAVIRDNYRPLLALQNPDTALFAPTVQDEIRFRNRGGDCGRWMETMGLAPLAHRSPMTLSMGQKQKVVLASIMSRNPAALLLDEPASQLDECGRKALADLIESLSLGGTAVIAATCGEHGDLGVFDETIKLSNGNGHLADLIMAQLPEPGREIMSISSVVIKNGASKLLNGIDMSLRAGELVCLAGMNGSGKSSLLKTVAGIWKADSGKIVGRNLSFAYLPQNPEQLLFQPTVMREILYSTARSNGALQSARSLASDLGIDHLLDNSPHNLSLGQKQAVALASVLMQKADVYLLDEPFAYLDGNSAAGALSIIYRMASDGAAFLITSHNGPVAGAHRRVVLKDGKVEEEGRA